MTQDNAPVTNHVTGMLEETHPALNGDMGTMNTLMDTVLLPEDGAATTGFLPDVARVAVVGDLHGNVNYTRRVINYAFKDVEEANADVIVQVGDFGFWGMGFVNAVQVFMENYPDKYFLFVDGNHEHHRQLNAVPVDEDGVRRLSAQVWHLPRGFRWTWNGITCVAVGGAPSVDANWRHAGSDWFPEEKLTPQEYMKIVLPGKADVVFAHDAPGGYAIPNLPPAGTFPHNTIADAEHYRNTVMKGIGEALTPMRWWHGHYHVNYEECLFWEDGSPCLVRGLRCDGAPFNTVVDFWTP